MAKLTPVYYLESGSVKFWQQKDSSASATVITPNAIVAKKQSNAEITYNPYEKYTLVAIYNGEAEVADLATGKTMLLSSTSDGKPKIAIIAFAAESSPSAQPAGFSTKPSSSGLNISILIAVGLFAVVTGYMILRKRLYFAALYNRLKEWSLAKIRKGGNNE